MEIRGNLTLNLGVRYEYVSPLTEENNRIANLDLSPAVLNPALGTPAVAVVLPGQIGPYSGNLPPSLVRPDRNNFAPRVGFAWKPFSKTVVRGGYGINYNTGAYQGMVQQLAFQPPFSTTQTNIQSRSLGILRCKAASLRFPTGGITNNYAVNPNYRLGYVQIRNLDIQQQIRPTLLLNIDYTGTKGTDLDILEAPNRTATGILIPTAQAFTYENSVGDSEANAGSVRLRKRLANGFSIGGIYTFSKSIDDASSIGAGATSGSGRAGLGAGGTGCRWRRRLVGWRSGVAWRRMLWICRRSAVSQASIRRKNSQQIICGNCRLDTTSAGSPEIRQPARFSATGSGAATGPSPPDCLSRHDLWVHPAI